MTEDPLATSPTGAANVQAPPETPTDTRRQDALIPVVMQPAGQPAGSDTAAPVALRLDKVSAYYGERRAVRDITMQVPRLAITAIIGPSGCGKSTLLRCIDRMHELTPGARVDGRIEYHGVDLYGRDIDPVSVRRTIGMVFQQPNPFPTMSIFDNVAAPARFNGVVKGKSAQARRAMPSSGCPVGRGQGQAQGVRELPVGRAAATPVHRSGAGPRARPAPHG